MHGCKFILQPATVTTVLLVLTLSFKLLDHLRHEVVVVGLSPLLQAHSQSLVQPVKLYTEMHRQKHAQIVKKADTYAEGRYLYSVPTHTTLANGWCGVYTLAVYRMVVCFGGSAINKSPHPYLVNLLQNPIRDMHHTGHG